MPGGVLDKDLLDLIIMILFEIIFELIIDSENIWRGVVCVVLSKMSPATILQKNLWLKDITATS